MSQTSMQGDVDKESNVALFRGSKLTVSERIARVFVLYPRTLLAVFWLVVFTQCAVVVSQGWFNIQETTQFDWTVPRSEESKAEDALSDARTELDSAINAAAVAVRSQVAGFTGFQIIFEFQPGKGGDKDLFSSPRNLQLMCEFQRVITSDPEYPKFCGTDAPQGESTLCKTVSTDLVAFFYSQDLTALDECPLLEQSLVDSKRAQLPSTLFGFFMERQPVVDGVAKASRSMIEFYGPLGSDSTPSGTTYSNPINAQSASDDEQFDAYDKFTKSVETKLLSYLGLEKESFFVSAYSLDESKAVPLGTAQDEIQVRFHSWYIRQAEFQRLVQSDELLVSAAVFLVGAVMVWHTRSLFVTSVTMFSILLSIPVALFFYAGVFGIVYFSDIHIVSIFIILGIGANDVFVFFDAYRQSSTMWKTLRGTQSKQAMLEQNIYGTGDQDKEVLIARIAYTFYRATLAVFNTSFTTFSAFMATGVSPIAPVAAFGYFSAIAILMNWVFTMALYPSVAVVYHLYFEGKPFCCACIRTRRDEKKEEEKLAVVASAGSTPAGIDEQGTAELAAPVEEDQVHDDCMVRIFSKLYLPALQYKVSVGGFKIHPVALIASIALLVSLFVFGSFTFQLSTPTTRDDPFNGSHMFTGFLDDFANLFGGSSDAMEAEVTFGIKTIDRGDGFSRFDPNGFRGDVIYDENFDLAPRDSQQFVLDFCSDLRAVSCVPSGASEAYPGCLPSSLAVSSVSCTLEIFRDWLSAAYGEDSITLGENDAALWTARMLNFSQTYPGMDQKIGFVGGRLRFFVLTYQSTLKGFSPYETKQPVFELLYEFFDAKRQEAPSGVQSFFQTSFDLVWSQSEIAIVNGMYLGLAISLSLAYVVLIGATRNLALSLFAIVSIVSIVATVLGTAYLVGWSLGIGEAIAAIMVIGLSVDYVIHLGSTYTHAGKEGLDSRGERFQYASTYMGPTILAGALTTGGSVAILFLCQLQFFAKMGTLICLTIFASVIYTFFFFGALCVMIGPERTQFDIIALMGRCKRGCK